MITIDGLRREFGAGREVSPYGFVIVVPADKFDPDWEVYLADHGFKCIEFSLGGKPVVLVKRSAAEGKSVLLPAEKAKKRKCDDSLPKPENGRGDGDAALAVASGFVLKDWDRAPVVLEKLSDLVLEKRLYPRKGVDQKQVQNYARAMRAGAKFPTLKVALFRGQKWLVDGFHRHGAYCLNKEGFANCSELPFSGEGELFAEAVRLNAGHGKGFTERELKSNVKRLWKFKFKVDEIQSLVSVPAVEVRRISSKPIERVFGPNGRSTAVSADAALKEFRSALVLCRRWAETGKVPLKDPAVKQLVVDCRLALGRVKFEV